MGEGAKPPEDSGPATSPEVPRIPDHELILHIGHGAYGEVWLARNIVGTPRAVKIVYRGRFETNEAYEREFEGIRQCEPISRGHEGLVDLLQIGRDDTLGCYYYVMECADPTPLGSATSNASGDLPDSRDPRPVNSGALSFLIDAGSYSPKTLKQVVRARGYLPLDECIQIGVALASALAHLHKNGLVHRDVKPSNVVFAQGTPKLADYGLVAVQSDEPSFVGTEGFIPSEGHGKPPADMYSLGKLLYEISTGLDRFRFPDPPTRLAAPVEQGRWREFNDIVLKACEESVPDRYSNAEAMLRDLIMLQWGDSPFRSRSQMRRLWKAVGAMAATTLIALAVTFTHRMVTQSQLEEQRRQIAANAREVELARKLIAAERKMDFLRVDGQFAADNSAAGLAQLAGILRQDPSNQVAAVRLMSALSDRSFALPVCEPMRHEEEVYWAGFSPDQARVVTASADGTARVWDAKTGQPLTPPMRHADEVKFACFSPDGRRVVTASIDHTARVWDGSTGRALTPPLRHAAAVNDVQFSPDGKWVATASKDGTARLWNAETGQSAGVPMIHADEVHGCRFFPDGRRLVTASKDRSAKIWDVPGCTLAYPALEHEDSVHFVGMSPDGSRIVTGCENHVAILWNGATGQRLGEPLKHAAQVRMAAFSPDGGRVVTASWDDTARVWDAATGQPITPPMKHANQVRWAEFSPDGLHVATASADFSAKVWDAWSGSCIMEPIRHGHKLRSVVFSYDGTRLLTSSADRTATIWDIRNGASIPGYPTARYHIHADGFSPDGRRDLLYVAGDLSRRLVVPGPQSGLQLRHADRINMTVFSADGRLILTASDDGSAQVWDVVTAEPVGEPMAHKGPVLSARFSLDSRKAVTASKDGTARLWDARTGKPLGKSMRHERQVRWAEFSPDGSLIVTASDDNTVRLWDGLTGQPTTPPLGHRDAVLFAHFHPDGSRILSAGKDFEVRVWDAKVGKQLTPPLKHGAEITRAEWSPEGSFVATACEDRSVRVWDAMTGHLISGPMRHTQALSHVAISPHGRRIATATKLGTIRLWDSRSGLPFSEPKSVGHPVSALEFSLRGDSLLSLWLHQREELRLPPLDFTIPHWLPDLAEEISRLVWVSDTTLAPLPQSRLSALARRLRLTGSNDFPSSWARWFLGDRNRRMISALATQTVADCVDQILGAGNQGDASKVISYEPTNAIALLILAKNFSQAKAPSACYEAQTMLLCNRALEYAPEDRAVWGEIIERGYLKAKLVEPYAVFTENFARKLSSINLWIARGLALQGLRRRNEAGEAFETALKLAGESLLPPSRRRHDMLLTRACLLQELGRLDEARADFRSELNVAPRDPTPALPEVDLSAMYNAPLSKGWSGGVPGSTQSLFGLGEGLRVIEGIRYDIRGLVVLCANSILQGNILYPERVSKISIAAKRNCLHILHGAETIDAPRAEIASYVVQFADGSTIRIPMDFGQSVWDWDSTAPNDALGKRSVSIWRTAGANGRKSMLFHTLWENPKPNVEIAHLDFASSMTEAVPFLVAITGE